MNPRAILLAGIAAIAPAMAPGTLDAATSHEAPRFAAPDGPLFLTRTVVRNLRDGKQIVVERRYAVRFVPSEDGYRLDGQLLDTRVDAPSRLAVLADIERNRPDVGTFPIELDRQGRIRSGPRHDSADRAVADRATAETRTMLGETSLVGTGRGQAENQIAQIAAAAAGLAGQWPADLFSCASGERQERRTVPLGDGQQGEVTVSIRADGPLVGGLHTSVVRTITTVIEGSTRTSSEVWTLSR